MHSQWYMVIGLVSLMVMQMGILSMTNGNVLNAEWCLKMKNRLTNIARTVGRDWMVKQMDDLIERDKVIRYLRDEVPLGTFMKRTIANADGACWSICDGIANDIPPVDAQPVRHGKWLPVETETGIVAYGVHEMAVTKYQCSECFGEIDISDGYFQYCPHCGAKMDAERRTE